MSTQIRKIIAEQLKAARQRRGLDQSSLARSCGLQPSMISHLEQANRTPSLETLLTLADALNVPAELLLGRGDAEVSAGPRLQELLSLANTLHDRDLLTVLNLARDLAERHDA